MFEKKRIAKRISSLCVGFVTKRYTRSKLMTDPLYEGVFAELKDSELPLLDIGCGMGILGMYLRERGWANKVAGFDYDSSKISEGRAMLSGGNYEGIILAQGDARKSLPDHSGDVTILDILQFFTPEEREQLLRAVAVKVPAGGRLIIRSGLAAKTLRFRITWLIDLFAKLVLWMKAAPVDYPTEGFFRKVLESEGFDVEIRTFWGKTPFNNYMILAKRPG